MFVSSYNTYIDTSTKRAESRNTEKAKSSSSTFEPKLSQTTPKKDLVLNTKLPLNYISDYKALNNQQKLQEQEVAQNPAKMKFSKISSINSANVAYGDNSKIFSLILKPKQTINQTPTTDRNLPKQAQEAQEDLMKKKMVNTYTANENYYNITAA